MWITLATKAWDLAETWLDNKKEEKKATATAEIALKHAEAEVYRRKATHESEWDLEAMRGSKDSLKDEWLLFLFSIPFIMAFIPPLQPYVKQGFDVLENCPDWYKAGLGVMIAASFGMRSFTKIRGK
tara:strand:+ start:727 stop:1107 length:381 start_codon:yes stop_codon:yes gene_type:complete